MHCLRVNVTSPRRILMHILMSLANKLLCILSLYPCILLRASAGLVTDCGCYDSVCSGISLTTLKNIHCGVVVSALQNAGRQVVGSNSIRVGGCGGCGGVGFSHDRLLPRGGNAVGPTRRLWDHTAEFRPIHGCIFWSVALLA